MLAGRTGHDECFQKGPIPMQSALLALVSGGLDKVFLIDKKDVSANLLDTPGKAVSVEFPHHIYGLQHN